MSSALPDIFEDVDITQGDLPNEWWESGYAFCTSPTEPEAQAARFQFMIRKWTQLASAASRQSDFVDNTYALNSKVSRTLVDEANGSACRTATGKRKAIDTGNPKPRKTTKNSATVLVTPEPANLPKLILPLAPPTSQLDNRPLDQSNKHNTCDETTLPIAEAVLSNETRCRTNSLVRLSPSGKGDNWLDIWADVVSVLQINKNTGDNPRWISLLTKVLGHTFGYDGVNNVFHMAEQVYNNLDLLELDSTTSLDGAQDSPFRSAAVCVKNIWARSKGDALMTVEVMVYYTELAENFSRLERDTYDSETSIGQDWLEYSENRTKSLQVRQNFVFDRILEYITPSSTSGRKKKNNKDHTRGAKKQKKDKTFEEMKQDRDRIKLQKERIMARNIALMVRLFGHGILPLMGSSTWRETLSQYAAATAEPLLTELLAECPILRQICDSVDKNFYQYVRIRGKIVDLPENCLIGCNVSLELPEKYTLAYLLAAPGELSEQPVDSMNEEMHVTLDENDERSSNERPAEVRELRGVGEELAHDAFNDDLEDALGELVGSSSWLKAVADRVNDNGWKYFTHSEKWGHMPAQHPRVEAIDETQHRVTSMLTLVSLEDQDDDVSKPMF
ncbi:hypothetical protein KCU85_g7207, partial [Aureobasidium melanogenum]